MNFTGLSALSGILGGIGGFGAGVGQSMKDERDEKLKRDELAIKQQLADQQQAQFDVTQRDKYIQPGTQIDALSKELGVNLVGMPIAALPEVAKIVQAKQTRQDELTAGGQIATQWGNVFGDPNTVVGDTGPQRPVITDKVVGPLAGLLTSGGYKPSMAPAIENAMKYVGEKELKAQERARDDAILSRFGLGPSAQPGGPPALGAPAADVDPAAMGVPQPVAAGGGIALPPGGGPAPEGGPAPARPGGGLAGYEPPNISIKVGPATIALKPSDVSNDYSAAALFASEGRTTNLQQITAAERPIAEQYLRKFQQRSPDMFAADLLQSGDPKNVALAQRYQQLQLDRSRATAQANQDVKLAQPIGADAFHFVHKQTMQHPPPDMSATDIYRTGQYVTISPSQLPAVRQLTTTKNLVDSIERTVLARPDLFPPSSGNATSDAAAVTAARAKYAGLTNPLSPFKGTDKDVADLESNLIALPTAVRAFGDVGNIAIQEQVRAAQSLGMRPETREAALARVDNIRGLLNGPIGQAGLPPLMSPTRGQGGTDKTPRPAGAGEGNISRTDPLYQHARSKGLTDQQIKKRYGLNPVD